MLALWSLNKRIAKRRRQRRKRHVGNERQNSVLAARARYVSRYLSMSVPRIGII